MWASGTKCQRSRCPWGLRSHGSVAYTDLDQNITLDLPFQPVIQRTACKFGRLLGYLEVQRGTPQLTHDSIVLHRRKALDLAKFLDGGTWEAFLFNDVSTKDRKLSTYFAAHDSSSWWVFMKEYQQFRLLRLIWELFAEQTWDNLLNRRPSGN